MVEEIYGRRYLKVAICSWLMLKAIPYWNCMILTHGVGDTLDDPADRNKNNVTCSRNNRSPSTRCVYDMRHILSRWRQSFPSSHVIKCYLWYHYLYNDNALWRSCKTAFKLPSAELLPENDNDILTPQLNGNIGDTYHHQQKQKWRLHFYLNQKGHVPVTSHKAYLSTASNCIRRYHQKLLNDVDDRALSLFINKASKRFRGVRKQESGHSESESNGKERWKWTNQKLAKVYSLC